MNINPSEHILVLVSSGNDELLMLDLKVSSKTVAQCVEFYYTYKKQVKIGRNGTLLYGEAEPPETKPTTEEEVDNKVSSCGFVSTWTWVI